MKKYLQITVILGLFFAIVWWQNHHGTTDETPLVSIPTTAPTTPNTGSTTPSSSTGSTGATSSSNSTPTSTGQYKDGTYTGPVEDAFYGNVQVRATVSGGKITSIVFLQHPSDNGTSQRINNQAMPLLIEEALQAQSAQVDGVTGASLTSPAFVQSLSGALSQAS